MSSQPGSPSDDLSSYSKEELIFLIRQMRHDAKKSEDQVVTLKTQMSNIALRAEEEEEHVVNSMLKKFSESKRHEETALNASEEEHEKVVLRLMNEIETLKKLLKDERSKN
jgi:hypothetical protein